MLTINNTLDGYLKDVEIKGNTIQDSENLADIRSVGDKIEGQELYEIPVLSTNGLDKLDSDYQEDKLTILSPTPLEKVGDVADRIICKDGVWGVEKNVKTVRLGSESAWYMRTNKNGITIFNTKDYFSNNIPNRVILCDTLTVSNGADQDAIDGYNQILAHKNSNYSQNLYISKDFKNIQLFTAWLDENPVNIKCVTETQPQFIPIPHDQQVKLRTFASKTNISFLTKIEGTIKAQVPKSIGATVNTHTEQINNLNKELDRVKKLEESTVSTVTTESDFTTVEATSNGYFEDVKLEGKTLVVNSDNEVVEPGTDGAMLKSVGDGVDEIVVSSNNNQPKQIKTTDDNSITTTIDNPNYQSDKKRLLYYNNETQAWEKPVLREWDSIEKHADGKYYYHQRSGEVVLNGSESWASSNSYDNDTTKLFRTTINDKVINYTDIIFDKFTTNRDTWRPETISECGSGNNDNVNVYIRILKSKLSTQDVQGFKQWLQANNVTVVYQLAQEKVYECTNIDLITYANETNYVVSCGAIVPKTTLKVHNNISNVVSLLQKKVSLLESNITKYMITQNRLQLSSTYSADSVTFKVDCAVYSENRSQENYDADLYNLILNNILVGKDNYDYDHMFNIIMDYASWSQISWDQFDILVGIMDLQHNPPIEEIPTDDETVEEIPNEII